MSGLSNLAGVVLCGGKSTRMGTSKALLPLGEETMLERVVRILGEVVQPIVVVGAAGQPLPELPPCVLVVQDEQPEQGPLEGLRCGLRAVRQQTNAEAAFVTSCDVPLLAPDFVRRMADALEDADVAVPVEGTFHHPLAAVYRTGVIRHLDALLDAGQRRPVFLFDKVTTRRVPVESLRDVDPELDSLTNVNHPDDYAAVLDRLGLPRRTRES